MQTTAGAVIALAAAVAVALFLMRRRNQIVIARVTLPPGASQADFDALLLRLVREGVPTVIDGATPTKDWTDFASPAALAAALGDDGGLPVSGTLRRARALGPLFLYRKDGGPWGTRDDDDGDDNDGDGLPVVRPDGLAFATRPDAPRPSAQLG